MWSCEAIIFMNEHWRMISGRISPKIRKLPTIKYIENSSLKMNCSTLKLGCKCFWYLNTGSSVTFTYSAFVYASCWCLLNLFRRCGFLWLFCYVCVGGYNNSYNINGHWAAVFGIVVLRSDCESSYHHYVALPEAFVSNYYMVSLPLNFFLFCFFFWIGAFPLG